MPRKATIEQRVETVVDPRTGESVDILIDDGQPGADRASAITAAIAVQDAWIANNGVQLEVCKCGACDSIHLRFWCGGILLLDFHQPPSEMVHAVSQIMALMPGGTTEN